MTLTCPAVIVSALYGADGKFADILAPLCADIASNNGSFTTLNIHNWASGKGFGDPNKGAYKNITLEFSDGNSSTYEHNQQFDLNCSGPEYCVIPPNCPATIVGAHWGTGGKYADIMTPLCAEIASNNGSVTIANIDSWGTSKDIDDPFGGQHKQFVLNFSDGNSSTYYKNDDAFQLNCSGPEYCMIPPNCPATIVGAHYGANGKYANIMTPLCAEIGSNNGNFATTNMDNWVAGKGIKDPNTGVYKHITLNFSDGSTSTYDYGEAIQLNCSGPLYCNASKPQEVSNCPATIVSARYGANGKYANIMSLMCASLVGNSGNFSTDSIAKWTEQREISDPIYNTVKQLELTFADGTSKNYHQDADVKLNCSSFPICASPSLENIISRPPQGRASRISCKGAEAMIKNRCSALIPRLTEIIQWFGTLESPPESEWDPEFLKRLYKPEDEFCQWDKQKRNQMHQCRKLIRKFLAPPGRNGRVDPATCVEGSTAQNMLTVGGQIALRLMHACEFDGTNAEYEACATTEARTEADLIANGTCGIFVQLGGGLIDDADGTSDPPNPEASTSHAARIKTGCAASSNCSAKIAEFAQSNHGKCVVKAHEARLVLLMADTMCEKAKSGTECGSALDPIVRWDELYDEEGDRLSGSKATSDFDGTSLCQGGNNKATPDCFDAMTQKFAVAAKLSQTDEDPVSRQRGRYLSRFTSQLKQVKKVSCASVGGKNCESVLDEISGDLDAILGSEESSERVKSATAKICTNKTTRKCLTKGLALKNQHDKRRAHEEYKECVEQQTGLECVKSMCLSQLQAALLQISREAAIGRSLCAHNGGGEDGSGEKENCLYLRSVIGRDDVSGCPEAIYGNESQCYQCTDMKSDTCTSVTFDIEDGGSAIHHDQICVPKTCATNPATSCNATCDAWAVTWSKRLGCCKQHIHRMFNNIVPIDLDGVPVAEYLAKADATDLATFDPQQSSQGSITTVEQMYELIGMAVYPGSSQVPFANHWAKPLTQCPTLKEATGDDAFEGLARAQCASGVAKKPKRVKKFKIPWNRIKNNKALLEKLALAAQADIIALLGVLVEGLLVEDTETQLQVSSRRQSSESGTKYEFDLDGYDQEEADDAAAAWDAAESDGSSDMSEFDEILVNECTDCYEGVQSVRQEAEQDLGLPTVATSGSGTGSSGTGVTGTGSTLSPTQLNSLNNTMAGLLGNYTSGAESTCSVSWAVLSMLLSVVMWMQL